MYNTTVNADLLDITWNKQIIERKDSMKYHGITFDGDLSFKYNVDHILQKAKRGLTTVNITAAKGLEQYCRIII